MPRKRGIIETDRLILRPLYDTDAKDLYTIGSDEQTAYWAGMYRYDDIRDALLEIEYLDGYGITVKGDDRVIGLVGVNESANAANNWTAQLGYFLAKECRGHGYMPEAVSAICNRMFESDDTERVMLESARTTSLPARWQESAVSPRTRSRPTGVSISTTCRSMSSSLKEGIANMHNAR